jgi:hypothetical protein
MEDFCMHSDLWFGELDSFKFMSNTSNRTGFAVAWEAKELSWQLGFLAKLSLLVHPYLKTTSF